MSNWTLEHSKKNSIFPPDHFLFTRLRSCLKLLGNFLFSKLLFVWLCLFFAFRAVWLNVPGLIIIVTLCFLDGLVIFAVYSGCDLRAAKRITSNDQVLRFTGVQTWKRLSLSILESSSKCTLNQITFSAILPRLFRKALGSWLIYSPIRLFVYFFFTLQTLPYFVINKLGHLHGLPGMFTACLYAGALRYITQLHYLRF